MFFDINTNPSGTTHKYLNEMHKVGRWKIFLDNGWISSHSGSTTTFKKGYSTESEIVDAKAGQTGNFCIITCKSNSITIEHDDCRGFPIYWSNDMISNLYSSSNQLWTGQTAFIEDDKVKCKFGKLLLDSISTEKQNVRVLLDLVETYFKNYIAQYLKYNADFYLADSSGIDTLTLSALANKAVQPVEPLIICNSPLSEYIKTRYWGYKQLPNKYNFVGTGFCGDEFMMRNPLYVSWYLKFHNIDLQKMYSKNPDTYMEGFIKHRYLDKISKDSSSFRNEKEMQYQYMNNMLNDFQMWHLNETITFTPFKNRYVPHLLLSMKPKDVLTQVTDALFSKNLIYRNNPNLISKLSANKNDVLP